MAIVEQVEPVAYRRAAHMAADIVEGPGQDASNPEVVGMASVVAERNS